MMLRNSFCKQVLQICKRNLWALTLSILGFCLCLPLPVAIMVQQYYSTVNYYQSLSAIELAEHGKTYAEFLAQQHTDTSNNLMTILGSTNLGVRAGIVIMAFLLGVALFRYLHDQRQVDLHHALPVKREQLFATRFTAGVAMVLPILWVIRLVTLLIIAVLGFVGPYTLTAFAWSFVTDTVFFLLIFSFVALCTLVTGNTIITVLLSVWAMFFVPTVTGLLGYFADRYLSTYRGFDALSSWLITRFSPVIQYFVLSTDNSLVDYPRFMEVSGLGKLCFAFAIVACVHVALAVVLFRKRKSETAGQSVAFDWCKFPIKLSLCIVAGLCGWMLFESIGNGTIWAAFGLVLCTAIVHAVSEIIIQHDFKALFSKKLHFGVIVIALLGGIYGLQVGSVAIDSRIPSASSLKGVMLECNRDSSAIGEANALEWGLNTPITDPDNIDIVMQLAQMGVDYINGTPNANTAPADTVAEVTVPSTVEAPVETPTMRLQITFVPKFGFPSERIFYVNRTPEALDLIDQLRTSEAYQKLANPIVRVTDIPAQSKNLRITVRTADVMYGDSSLAFIDGPAVEQVLASLQQDILSLTPEQRKNDVPLMRLDFSYTSNGGTWLSDVGIYPSFHQTIALIAAETGILPAQLDPAQVESMIVYYNPDDAEAWATVDAIERSLRDYSDMMKANDGEFVSEYALDEDMELPEDPNELRKFMEAYGYSSETLTWAQTDPITITDQAVIAQLLDGALTENMQESTDIAFQQDEQAGHFSVAAVLHNGDMLQVYYPEGTHPAEVLCRSILTDDCV